MKNILEVKNLTKRYEDGASTVIALDKVSLDVAYGEDIAILGPSGSGKTTFLQLAGGLDRATSGSVIVDGRNIEDMSDKEISDFRNTKMGFIFQMIHLQDFFTAKENIMLPMLVAGKSKEKAEEKAELLLKKVGLSHRKDHLPRQLSGGEQQRVAVARALANDPKLIFADEPTGKLDKDNSKMVIDLLENLSKENGLSVVIITHDPNIAKRFSRVIHIEHGKIVSNKSK
jgi:ABC-type lipoprotein export system ATPase subunit